MKQQFINKWSTWFILNPRREELTTAFEKELDAIIEQKHKADLVPIHKEITELYQKEIELFKHVDFLEQTLNYCWNNAFKQLQRKDLGDIERKNYEYQLQKSKQLLKLIGCL